MDKGGLSKLENGLTDPKITTLWMFAEASGMKLSELIMLIEEKVGQEFKFIEE